MRTSSPYDIKRLGNNIDATNAWLAVRDSVMRDILRSKFAVNKYVQRVLRETGDKVLFEATADRHFGAGIPLHKIEFNLQSLPGSNVLGKLLQEVRTSLPSLPTPKMATRTPVSPQHPLPTPPPLLPCKLLYHQVQYRLLGPSHQG